MTDLDISKSVYEMKGDLLQVQKAETYDVMQSPILHLQCR